MSTAPHFAALAATTGQPIELYMQRLWLSGQVLPVGARLIVEHAFRSKEDQAVEVIYSFPLPRDAALRSFRIRGEDFDVHSELKETEQAVKVYEEGIAKGSLSALARQYGDGVVNLTVGDIRKKETVTVQLEILCGVELRDDGLRFRFPFTLAPGYHAQAKTASTAPGVGEIELPADKFGDLILPRFHDDPSVLHQVGFELTLAGQLILDGIGSPSHAVQVRQTGSLSARVALAGEKDVPDRDLILDVHFESVEPQVFAGVREDGRGHFAAIVPSTCFGAPKEGPRRVVILLDSSGSMLGGPIWQAHRAIEACLGALSDTDSFGLVVFNDHQATFRPSLSFATRALRDEARQFMFKQAATGGTNLTSGILQAAKLLAGEEGDILVITDGQVFGTEKILADARTVGSRLHCLGIGSASQDRFLALLARETGGVSRFLTPGERVDVPAVDLFASIGRPSASGLKASENIQPEPPSFVFRGTPVLLFGEATEPSDNQINLTWDGGTITLPVEPGAKGVGETVWLLQGSRLITDWESRYPAEEATAPLEKRKESRVAHRLLQLSQTYGLASREMSLVAVVKRGDRAGQLPETHVVPLGMPKGTKFGAYFGGPIPTGIVRMNFLAGAEQDDTVNAVPGISIGMAKQRKPPSGLRSIGMEGATFGATFGGVAEGADPAAYTLILLAGRLEPDGGMPGKDVEARAIATVLTLLAFLSGGHTPTAGAFRAHAARLVLFLENVKGLSKDHRKSADAVIALARKGKAPAGEWLALAHMPGDHWKAVETSLKAEGPNQ